MHIYICNHIHMYVTICIYMYVYVQVVAFKHALINSVHLLWERNFSMLCQIFWNHLVYCIYIYGCVDPKPVGPIVLVWVKWCVRIAWVEIEWKDVFEPPRNNFRITWRWSWIIIHPLHVLTLNLFSGVWGENLWLGVEVLQCYWPIRWFYPNCHLDFKI